MARSPQVRSGPPRALLSLCLGLAVALSAPTGCTRRSAPPAPAADQPLQPDPSGAALPSAGATAPTPSRPVPAMATPRPGPRRVAPPLKPRPAPPLVVRSTGAAPRVTLRYRFSNEEKLRWRVELEQLTHVRKEKQCPAKPDEKLRGPKVRTLPVRYAVDLQTVVTRAPDGLYQLDSTMANVAMTLPPALRPQRALLQRILTNLQYTRRMSARGRVTKFSFGKLTPKALTRLQQRLEAPLSHLQPMLPPGAVGVGAVWEHQRPHALQQPGGRIEATYLTRYTLKAVRSGSGRQVVDLAVETRVTLGGKLMGEELKGTGAGTARLTLDAEKGVVLKAQGSLVVCSAVMGRSSTNRTVFKQVFQPSTGARPAPRRRPPPTKAPTPPTKAPTPPSKAPTPPRKAPPPPMK